MGEEENKLNPNQEVFCQLYAKDRFCFGNGTKAYIIAYDIEGAELHESEPYKSASVMASNLLRKVKVRDRINELMNEKITDEVVDNELAFVIKQNKDLSSKVAAVREYNRVKKRVSDAPTTNIYNLQPEQKAQLDELLKQNQ